MNLFIVESPSKAKTIKKYLGKDFEVIATKGHVVDLPKSKMGVNLDGNFEADWEVKNASVIKEIKQLAKKSKEIFLATDLDREGEAIAYHVAKEAGIIDDEGQSKSKTRVHRVVFTEVTKEAVLNSIQNPGVLDMNKIYSQYSRRILDRVVGYSLSPILWKKIAFGLSAGRVQSVALRILVDREAERDSFQTEEYWKIMADFSTIKLESSKNISIKLIKKDSAEIEKNDNDDNSSGEEDDYFYLKTFGDNKDLTLNSEKYVVNLINVLSTLDYKVKSISTKQQKKQPPKPYTTSTFQQAAVNKLSMSSKRSMSVAQKLYERGLITYIRTDSVVMSDAAVKDAQNYILKTYGNEYISNSSISKMIKQPKNIQGAHECIRPVNMGKTPGELSLDADEYKVYDLIWKQAIASQMSPQILSLITCDIESNKQGVIFRNTKTEVEFLGYQIIFSYNNLDKGKIISDKTQSFKFEEKQDVFLKEILSTQHFTSPPARYTEATLIKKLEEEGIGRPSTYASIIGVIQQRTYVEKNGKYFIPTDIGKVVVSLLKKYFANIVDLKFTADLESKLDKIEQKDLNWVNFLKTFYKGFKEDLHQADNKIERAEFTQMGNAPSDVVCDDCGSSMIVKLGRYGKFYSCSKYPDCKGIKALESNLYQGAELRLEDYNPAPQTDDGEDYILKKGRYGYFWAHPRYPKVKDIRSLELKKELLFKQYGEPPKTDDGEDYILKKGRYGYFWAHPRYPEVKSIIKIK
jgi:DNA topoisomerase-1